MAGADRPFVGGVGYTNVDLIYSGLEELPGIGEEVFAKHFAMHLGGGVPATLINTSRLCVPSRILTFLGKDFFSGYAKKAYADYGAEVVNLYRGDGQPIILSSVLVHSHDRSFISYRDEILATDFAEEDIYRQLRGAKIVDMHVDSLNVYRRLKAEGTVLIFDTGWEDDLSIEKYKDYLELADYYLPNQKEALKITGAKTVEEAANVLFTFFPQAIVKLDQDGCLLKNEAGIQLIPPMKNVVAVDPTGAGDAFASGFIYGLYHDRPIEQCIRFGNVTGGTCVQSVGCLTSYVNEERLHALASAI